MGCEWGGSTSRDETWAPQRSGVHQRTQRQRRPGHCGHSASVDQGTQEALQQLFSVSNTCSGQVLDFSNTSSPLLAPSALFDWYLGAQKPPNSAKLSIYEIKCAQPETYPQIVTPNEDMSRQYGVFWPLQGLFQLSGAPAGTEMAILRTPV